MKEKTRVLELFAGSRSIGKVAEKMGMEVLSTDLYEYEKISYVGDILDFDYSKVPFIPDVIWASPPCTTFSVASLGHHWTGGKGAYIPKTDACLQGIAIIKKTLEIIEHYNPKLYFIENPRGVMRKMDFMQDLPRHTVTYCQYGDNRMKPTDIWTNSKTWKPKPMCKNGDPCHVSAPRGSRTGTQGLKGNFERSIIPEELCKEIMTVCEKEINLMEDK